MRAKRPAFLSADGSWHIPLTGGFEAIVDSDDVDLAGNLWCAAPDGRTTYAQRKEGGKIERMHRVVLSRMMVLGGSVQVDHINGNGLDNRRSNLRPATAAENRRNRRTPVNNTTGDVGVRPFRNRWKAAIANRHIGYFDTREQALAARRAAERRVYGEFARASHDAE